MGNSPSIQQQKRCSLTGGFKPRGGSDGTIGLAFKTHMLHLPAMLVFNRVMRLLNNSHMIVMTWTSDELCGCFSLFFYIIYLGKMTNEGP